MPVRQPRLRRASDGARSRCEIGVPHYSSLIAAARGRYNKAHSVTESMQQENVVGTSRKVMVDLKRADGMQLARQTLREIKKIIAEATSGLLAFCGKAARINAANSLKEVS